MTLLEVEGIPYERPERDFSVIDTRIVPAPDQTARTGPDTPQRPRKWGLSHPANDSDCEPVPQVTPLKSLPYNALRLAIQGPVLCHLSGYVRCLFGYP